MFASVNGERIFYEVMGLKVRVQDGVAREVPTVLILHGGPGMDHLTVVTDLLALADQFQLVWIDHRANGRSSGSDRTKWTLDQWADDVKDFCDAVGIEKPIVIGQSFGGHVAQAYAARHPDHPAKVVFSSILARWNGPLTIQRFFERGGETARVAAENFWNRQNAEDRATYREVCYAVYGTRNVQDPLRAGVTEHEAVTHHYLRPDGEFQTRDLRPDLARVTCPTLVLAGTDDPVIPWEQSREMADAVINAPVQYVQLDGCGHGIWRDKPEQSRAIIAAFILGEPLPV